MKPLAIDLFCGLSGWGAGLIAAGFRVVGFDIENMFDALGEPLPERDFNLVIQNVLTLHGSQFKDAHLIVASPPCQEFSYMAMPWSRAKAKAARIRADDTGEAMRKLTALVDACYRIQREASEAAGRRIPMVFENVRGAIPWIGRSKYAFGSYHLWADVPALMPTPIGKSAVKAPGLGAGWVHPDDPRHTPGLDFTRLAARSEEDGRKVPGFRFDGSGRSFQTASVEAHEGVKVASLNGGRPTAPGNGARFTSRDCGGEGQKMPAGTRWFNDGPRSPDSLATSSSKSPARKAASAKIARIPFTLAHWIGRVYYPD